MNKEMTSASSSKRPLAALMRSQWLWSVVVIFIMFWGIKGLQRAMQPKYEGKTAAEWYASTTIPEVGFVSSDEAAKLPVIIAFKNLGPEGCRYLWGEYTRDASLLDEWASYLKYKYLKNTEPLDHPSVRNMKAYFILQKLGADAEPVLPELLEALGREEPYGPSMAAGVVAEIRRQPDTMIPALLKSLTSTNRAHEDQVACIRAIGMYGASARPYLPQLKSIAASPTNDLTLRMSLAVATTRISGDMTDLKVILESMLTASPKQWAILEPAFDILEELGPEGREAVPVLIKHAPSWKSTSAFGAITEVILALDPDGVYQRP